jgi:homoserine kinase
VDLIFWEWPIHEPYDEMELKLLDTPKLLSDMKILRASGRTFKKCSRNCLLKIQEHLKLANGLKSLSESISNPEAGSAPVRQVPQEPPLEPIFY